MNLTAFEESTFYTYTRLTFIWCYGISFVLLLVKIMVELVLTIQKQKRKRVKSSAMQSATSLYMLINWNALLGMLFAFISWTVGYAGFLDHLSIDSKLRYYVAILSSTLSSGFYYAMSIYFLINTQIIAMVSKGLNANWTPPWNFIRFEIIMGFFGIPLCIILVETGVITSFAQAYRVICGSAVVQTAANAYQNHTFSIKAATAIDSLVKSNSDRTNMDKLESLRDRILVLNRFTIVSCLTVGIFQIVLGVTSLVDNLGFFTGVHVYFDIIFVLAGILYTDFLGLKNLTKLWSKGNKSTVKPSAAGGSTAVSSQTSSKDLTLS